MALRRRHAQCQANLPLRFGALARVCKGRAVGGEPGLAESGDGEDADDGEVGDWGVWWEEGVACGEGGAEDEDGGRVDCG